MFWGGQGTAALEASGKTSSSGKGWSPEVPGSPALTCLSVVRGLPPLTPAAPAQPGLLPPCQDLKKYGATTVVRVCEVTYDKTPLEKDGITVVVRRLARMPRLCHAFGHASRRPRPWLSPGGSHLPSAWPLSTSRERVLAPGQPGPGGGTTRSICCHSTSCSASGQLLGGSAVGRLRLDTWAV